MEAIEIASIGSSPNLIPLRTQWSMWPNDDISIGSTPSEQNISRLVYVPWESTNGMISFKSRLIEPSRIIIHIPNLSRSITCSKLIGSWQERIPDETYALSFFPLAPAVWPLMMQFCSCICWRDFIVLESLSVTLVQEKTSPNPITEGMFIAAFSCLSERVLPWLNFLSTGNPPGTVWKNLIGRFFERFTNSLKPL